MGGQTKLCLHSMNLTCTHTCTHVHRCDSYNTNSQKVKIALVGKYTKLSDSYASVIKALKHAALACRLGLELSCVQADMLEVKMKEDDPAEYHKSWTAVCEANGIIVPGGFGVRGTEGKVLAANFARTNNIPYLGTYHFSSLNLGTYVVCTEYSILICGISHSRSVSGNADGSG